MKLTEAERTEKIELTRKFYREHLVELPPEPQWRQFRCRLWTENKAAYFGGRKKMARDPTESFSWVKIHDTIYTPQQMQKWLVKLAPRDVYFMTSRFLNPQNVGPKKLTKPGFKWAYNIFLGSELYFDFDVKDIVSTLSMREYLMKKYGFQQVEVYETFRGFHIHCIDFEDKVEALKHLDKYWKFREEKYQYEKKKIADDLQKHGYKFDRPITIDTRRIIKLIGSIDGNGFVKTRVKTEELK